MVEISGATVPLEKEDLALLIYISCQPIQLWQIHFPPFQAEHFFFLHFHFFLPFFIYL